MSILGVNDVLGAYQYANRTQKAAASGTSFTEQLQETGKSGGVNFAELAATKAAGTVTGQSFEEMMKGKYPEMKIHQVDASKIPSGRWCRTDFPFEKFFDDNVDYDEVVNWKPSGAAPAMNSKECQARYQSTFGKKSVLVPPALQEKMDNDPALAQKVANTVDAFIKQSQMPPKAVSVLISLDENGEIANWTTCTEGGFMGPSEKELRMLAKRKREKEEKAAEYERIAKENAIKRKLREQQEDERYYKTTSIAREAVSAAYENNIMGATGILQ